MSEADEIVKILAAGRPPIDGEGYVESCAFCGITSVGPRDAKVSPGPVDIDDPCNHDSSCLWRRAKALYPDSKGD